MVRSVIVTTCLEKVDDFRCIDFRHNYNGHLIASLLNAGVTGATAHYCFTVWNAHGQRIALEGGSLADSRHSRAVFLYKGNFDKFFLPDVCDDRVELDLCPVTRIIPPQESYCDFSVSAEIRLKLQDNERWTVSVKRKTATCTVCSTVLRSTSMFDVCSGS